MKCNDYNEFSVLCQECRVTRTTKCCKTKCNQCNNVATDSGSGLCEVCEAEVEKDNKMQLREDFEDFYASIL